MANPRKATPARTRVETRSKDPKLREGANFGYDADRAWESEQAKRAASARSLSMVEKDGPGSERILGIDLGMTSVIAAYVPGTGSPPRVIPAEKNLPTLASVVAFKEAERPVVGRAAHDMLTTFAAPYGHRHQASARTQSEEPSRARLSPRA